MTSATSRSTALPNRMMAKSVIVNSTLQPQDECTEGGQAEVFIVEDLDKGIEVLESADVKYSVTGDDVHNCYLLMIEEYSANHTKWNNFDDSLSVDTDGLDFNL
ncbi:hypothetical protein P153DRAFT_384443 [Dothidotthia symphoricarpi CBS 119687]|uniref:Uncharacterized protein n=1 Tax=Dothidotthia symphoricarpi CBS 119687 TaxID=1392245 RepID=A0A6A6AI43_9PLEO|nr:uncharacterized protein P153DRAFT_384443 [Dothidotthia symphoricarpi CBS 119687]KAF2131226.1 hypothetical protein P153DRAFT_384443 [Dothidotthia symphoricarpi CBS 119687]